MGMKFRKSVKIAPGVKLNIGKKSTGVSVGGKYGGMSFNSKSGAKTRVSIPGTGISFSESIGASAHGNNNYQEKIVPISTAFDEKTIKSLNNAAFFEYAKGYTEYAKNLDPTEDSCLLKESCQTLEIIKKEYTRRMTENKSREPSLKLLICGIICCICGLITLFFTYLGIVFLIIGFIMLLLELKK